MAAQTPVFQKHTKRGIEILNPTLFPLQILNANPMKTRNPTPACNFNSRFPSPFWAQIPNITAKKCRIPHPAKPIGTLEQPQPFHIGAPRVSNICPVSLFYSRLQHVKLVFWEVLGINNNVFIVRKIFTVLPKGLIQGKSLLFFPSHHYVILCENNWYKQMMKGSRRLEIK